MKLNIFFLLSVIFTTEALPPVESPMQKITGMCKKQYETIVDQVKEKIHDVKSHTYNLFNNFKEKINNIKNRGKVEVEEADSDMKNDFDMDEFIKHLTESFNKKQEELKGESEYDHESGEKNSENENDERAL